MTVQFNIDSRHDENARFKKVLFGYDGQLLEVELNELQDVINSRRALLVNEVFGSRPLYVGTYAVAGGTLTLTNELVAINKELILLPTASIVVSSGDTIYLNYQEKTVSKTDTIKKYGYIPGSEVITNYLQDSRIPDETTRRVQATYQLTKVGTGTGTFLKLCTINGAGAVVQNTGDYPDSDLYKEIRRLASEVLTTSGAEANQMAFSNIAVAGQPTVAADLKTDTLTLAAGNGVTLTTDATTDTVTIAVPNATPTVSGAQSAADKAKLDGVATGAEVNQMTFSNVAVSGQPTVVADTKTDTLTLASGNAVVLTTDATTDTVTIAVPNATQTNAGAFSAADKAKLDGIASGASGAQNIFQNVAVGGVTLVADTTSDTLTINAGNAVSLTGDATTDTFTIAVPNATPSAAGAQSAADKAKLDGVATGAEVNQFAFNVVKVGASNVASTSKTDVIELVAGTNITLTPDVTNRKVTFTASSPAGTTAAAGILQLTDSTASTSTTTAATPNSVKAAYDLANAAIPNAQKAVANGVATLDATGKVVSTQLPALNYVPTTDKGAANGVATLDASSKVPVVQIPALGYVPTSAQGVANGVASLGADGKVPSGQLPSLNYVPTTDKGAANGVATLDASSKVPAVQLPAGTTAAAGALQLTDSVASTSTTTAATPNAVKQANDLAASVQSRFNDLEVLFWMGVI